MVNSFMPETQAEKVFFASDAVIGNTFWLATEPQAAVVPGCYCLSLFALRQNKPTHSSKCEWE